MTITVVHVRKELNNIYCGRGSALGNPFVMNNYSVAERDRVCDLYEVWFKQMLGDITEIAFHTQLDIIFKASKEGDINLGCYCAPKRCHCDTIKAYIESLSEV